MTKRRAIVIGVRRWVIVATVMLAAGAALGTAAGTWRPLPKTPSPKTVLVTVTPVEPQPCTDDAVMMYGEFYKKCDSRARLEVYPGEAHWALYKCVCRGWSSPVIRQADHAAIVGRDCKVQCEMKDALRGWQCVPPKVTVGCTSFTYEYSR